MSFLLILVLVIWLVSSVGLVILVLMHSGKGTGISDMLASSVYGATSGTAVIEKNLDRLTVIFAIAFILSLLALMLLYPSGSIA